MNILKVTNEGYGNLKNYFQYGDTYFVLPSGTDVVALRNNFKLWANDLGICPDAIYPNDKHPLSTHIYTEIIEIPDNQFGQTFLDIIRLKKWAPFKGEV